MSVFQVLLIEDSPDDVDLVKRALADSDFTVYATTTAAMACKFLDTAETDIILLDLNLPNGQGIELVDRIIARAKSAPVVLLTGSDDEAIIKYAVDRGVLGYVNKEMARLPKGEFRLGLLTSMHLAVKDRKGPAAPDSQTLRLLAEKIQQMKTKGDEAIDVLEKEAGLKEEPKK